MFVKDIMRKSIYKIAAYTTASMLTLSGFSLNVQASSLTDVLPSAGISYTLGSNSTALSDLQQSSTSNTQPQQKVKAIQQFRLLHQQQRLQKLRILLHSFQLDLLLQALIMACSENPEMILQNPIHR